MVSGWPHPLELLDAVKGGTAPGSCRPTVSAECPPCPIDELAKDNGIERPEPPTTDGDTTAVVLALFKRGSWRAVLNEVTLPVLTAHGQGPATEGDETQRPDVQHTELTLQMWLYRAIALWKLGQYTAAMSELNSFGSFDQVDLLFESYPDVHHGKKGSMVPFSLRLIRAELPSRLGKHDGSLVQLHLLKHACQTAIARLQTGKAEDGSAEHDLGDQFDVVVQVWQSRLQRVEIGIGNCLLRLQEFELAMQAFERVDVAGFQKGALLSGCARVALLQGDIATAKKYFDEADSHAHEASKSMNAGFLALTDGDYTAASAAFEKAWELNHDCAAAGNNQAVCQLYTGALTTAAAKLAESHESSTLHENVVFNLCTLYELQSSAAAAKKKALVPVIAEAATDAFDPKCLKL
eukprot:m.77128 g.77128  ORF g.77128 m.77128 type:complete len:408 (-) comp10584_c0_seq1:2237-3460(-)